MCQGTWVLSQLAGSRFRISLVFAGLMLTIIPRQESEADREEVRALQEAMIKTVPMEKLNERRVWRDKRLAALAKLKREMDKE